MTPPPKRTAARIALLGVVIVAGLAFLVWKAFQPKIHPATLAEIRAALPKGTLEPTPMDSAAEARYHKLIGILQPIDTKQFDKFDDKKNPASKAFVAVGDFWTSHSKLAADLAGLLQEGPIQEPASNAANQQMSPFTTLRSFVKAVAISARLYADHGDFETSTKLHLLGIQLSDRFLASDGVLIDYLVGVALEAVVTRSIDQTLAIKGFPTEDCRKLLSAYSPAPVGDEELATDLRRDFQRYALPMLPNPADPRILNEIYGRSSAPADSDSGQDTSRSKTIVGTYEAIETAKLYGNLILSSMAAARKPYSDLDKAVPKSLETDSETLPKEVDDEKPDGLSKTWETWKYRYLMDNSHNTIGRQMVDESYLANGALGASCRWRAFRNATRVLLASRLYRAAHGGSLPPTTDGFLPYLGSWPQDPFNGKPMIYNPTKEKVYSVGENLTDDGGDVSFELSKAQDIGVSLKQ